jgi:hypothetical protein
MSVSALYHRLQTKAGPISEAVWVYGQGHSGNHQATDTPGVDWERMWAKVGDEIVVRVIESDSCDPGELLP